MKRAILNAKREVNICRCATTNRSRALGALILSELRALRATRTCERSEQIFKKFKLCIFRLELRKIVKRKIEREARVS